MKKTSFALIGAGKMGTRWAGVISKYAGTELVAIVNPDLKKAQELAEKTPHCTATSDIKDVLKNKEIDAVLIATTHNYLSPITSSALTAGKHVLCEKPGAIKSEQIKKNIELSKRMGLVYKIGYNYRFHDGFIKARQFYKKGYIGKILFVRARHGFGGRAGYNKEWRLDKKIGGGGHLHDQGVHLIDMARSFIGKVEKVRGFMADSYWKAGTEDNAFVLLQGENNVIASIHSSLTQWKRLHSFEIYGTKGYLSVEGLGMRYGDGEKLIVGRRTKNPDTVKEKIIICNPIADNSLVYELKEFVSAVKHGTPLDPTPLDGYETLKIVEEVYKTNKL
ncbi:hypothetical protein A2803_05320 [Candidatus Woesebacteria bacterium RIFCSPHIGHO2_01_FULL_44_21]|uniref:Oxidoreductase n=1 Tax=Candidatus Woesebacteria bacterium RIFCSPHIGHO2_01_FULL_44_21 TaxID=1802503 RepID=A0A1F7YW54_9BACT|nr:MAG: hypothetical protein A2803_05320 [Candidatus Woesebacteria bacterium RIFCSPHIGHO2_01_FULL_44_21]